MHLMVLVSLSTGAVVWGCLIVSGRQTSMETRFLLLLGLFGLASAFYVFARVRENHLRFFDLPVFLTIVGFIRFGLIPAASLLNPVRGFPRPQVDRALLVQALAYVMLGVLAFWIGCTLARSSRKEMRAMDSGIVEKRAWILFAAVVLYALGFFARLYMLTHAMYSFVGSQRVYSLHLASAQVLMPLEALGTDALFILCVEKYCHPRDALRSLLFWIVFLSECGWGLISGMKAQFLGNFVIVAIVASLVQRRFRKSWVVAALSGLVFFYPISNRYRDLVRGQGALEVTSISTAAGALQEAATEGGGDGSGIARRLESGWQLSLARLDLLWSVGEMLSLGRRAELLSGKERLWMLPYYEFIPRFIWRSKPQLNEGARFDLALGGDGNTSVAVTYPGDLLVRYGVPGLLGGMLILGIVAQWLTDRMRNVGDKRALFVYAAIFLSAADMEIGTFSYWSGLIKSLVILSVIAFVVYGPRAGDARGASRRQSLTTQRA